MADADNSIIPNDLQTLTRQNLYNWTMAYRKITDKDTGEIKDFGFKYYPFIKKFYKDFRFKDPPTTEWVFMKASQMAISETAINASFYISDHGFKTGYILPTDFIVQTHVGTRVNDAIENSDYLKLRMSKKGINDDGDISNLRDLDNTFTKKIGDGYIYYRGSGQNGQLSRNLKTFPADFMIYDEVAELTEGVIELGDKRLNDSQLAYKLSLSTPNIPDQNIHKMYLAGTQFQWVVKCNQCGEALALDEEYVQWVWPYLYDLYNSEQIKKEDIFYPCKHCFKEFDRFAPGEWVAKFPEKYIHSYYLNKIYSYSKFAVPAFLFEKYLKGISNSVVETEFWNQDMGLPFIAKGNRLTDVDYQNAMLPGIYSDVERGKPDDILVMGIDVGRVYHVTIQKWLREEEWLTVYADAVDLGSVYRLLDLFKPNMTVIDLYPETTVIKGIISDRPMLPMRGGQNNKSMLDTVRQNRKFDDIMDYHREFCIEIMMNRIRKQKTHFCENMHMDLKLHLLSVFKNILPDGTFRYDGVKGENTQDHFMSSLMFSEAAKIFYTEYGKPKEAGFVFV